MQRGWKIRDRKGSRAGRAPAAGLILLTFGASCCSPDVAPSEDRAVSSPLFADVTADAAIDFTHENGATPRKMLPEIMGSGGCALDFDGDGFFDLYLVQSGSLTSPAASPANRLLRNRGDGTFEDVTESSGAGDAAYGMGAVCADYDNDGDPDIYVLNFGPDVLLNNRGDGRFEDVTGSAGIDNPHWGSSGAFLDADLDGNLDLYVANYLNFTVETHVDCGRPGADIFSYCHPDVYPMAPDLFFRNRGDGTFEEVTDAAGLTDTTGKGLGVVSADFNNDGWPDIYVANDSTPNFLFQNRGDGTFEDVGLLLGAAYNEEGKTEAGMGTDAGDLDGNGYLDLFVTNLSMESNSLLLGGSFEFSYESRRSGIFEASWLLVGFGTDLLDLDNDGDLDIAVTNGHVIDNVELFDDSLTFRQPSQVFWNDGEGRFSEAPPAIAGPFARPRVGRGTITLDYDNDGALDLLITSNGSRAELFRNLWGDRGSWIGFLLRGTRNRNAVGARVRVETESRILVDDLKAGSSYQTSNDPRLHFGLGGADVAERVTIRWPGGRQQEFESLPAGRYHVLVEPGRRATKAESGTDGSLARRR